MTANQNRAEYDRAAALLERSSIAQDFIASVIGSFPNAEVKFFVNTCTIHWPPGTPADYCIYIGLKDEKGHNVLSYNGGGKTILEAAIKGLQDLTRFIWEKAFRELGIA